MKLQTKQKSKNPSENSREDWTLDDGVPMGTKTLRQLADEYPEKDGLEQLAQAWEAGELF